MIAYKRMPVREWDGTSYDRVSGTMQELGLEVLERLELGGDEVVLDAGCGSGRITEALLERLPRGRVIAVDESASMAQAARRRLGSKVDIRVLDLLELELEEPVDAILSTATFHWISDHDRLFAKLHAALRRGGRLVAQCGGEGNIDTLRGKAHAVLAHEPYAAHFADWRHRGTTPGPGDAGAPACGWFQPRRLLARASPAQSRARRASSSPRSSSARTSSSSRRSSASRSWTRSSRSWVSRSWSTTCG